MKQYLDCDVTFDDESVEEDYRGGKVVINGDNATLWKRSPERRGAFDQVDRLSRIAVTEKGKDITIVGESRNMRENLNLRGKNAETTVKIHSRGGCPTC